MSGKIYNKSCHQDTIRIAIGIAPFPIHRDKLYTTSNNDFWYDESYYVYTAFVSTYPGKAGLGVFTGPGENFPPFCLCNGLPPLNILSFKDIS